MLPALLLLPTLGLTFGGWAAVTVEDLPDYAVARQALTLTYTVRQHGVTRLRGLDGRIEASAGSFQAAAVATPGSEPGQYTARLVLPQPGDWTLTIHSGFGNSRVKLLPMKVIEPGVAAPAALPAADRGRRLFVAKGCVSCHLHRDVEGSGVVAVGPELTGRRYAAEYLQLFLANPAIKPRSGNAEMPNLNLKPGEIAALIAFINAGQAPTGTGSR
jgi:mono/diheme cytochrome c family protein